MQQCGFCSLLSGLLRRAMCVGSRRGSTESYYRELGDQDTLKIEDKLSDEYNGSEYSQDDMVTSPCLSIYRIFEIEPLAGRRIFTGRFLTMHKRRKKPLVTRSLSTDRALLDDLHHGQVECILIQAAMWQFNAFSLETVSGGRCLPVLCIHLFQMYGLITHFKLDAAKTWKLFSLIEEGYHSTNPYHNSVHAADVTQAMHCFLQQKKIREHLEPLEILASLLAAIAHDIGHPGVNQPFLIATSNHLATLYNNTSVLENHHWRSAISCLIQSGLLDEMTEERPKLEQQISSLILATDITRQQEYLSEFKGHLDTNTLDMKKSEHRHLVLQIALKCADISNPCRPWDISRKWSMKVCEEFFRQGDYERQLNIPVTALCDRHNTSIPKIQTGFFKFVVTPLITEWDRFLHNDLSAQMLENLLFNQEQWEALLAREMEEEIKTELPVEDVVIGIDEDESESYSETNSSDSSDLLLPPRRSSLNANKSTGIKEHLRRFSVPVAVNQDTNGKRREHSLSASEYRSRAERAIMESELSEHPQLCISSHIERLSTANKILGTEKLLSDSSITSITTPVQATRLNIVMMNRAYCKIVRQQTFPPLVMSTRGESFSARPLCTSDEDAIYHGYAKPELTPDWASKHKPSSLITRSEKDKAERDNNTSRILEMSQCSDPLKSEETIADVEGVLPIDMEELPCQVEDIACALPDSELNQRRRKSIPTDTLAYSRKEKKMREMTITIPQLLCRSLSGKEGWSHRRGSAPAPVAPSELRGLVALSAIRHSVNGGRRKPNQPSTCQQWLQKTTYSVQERAMHLPRRSSLPVEVIAGA